MTRLNWERAHRRARIRDQRGATPDEQAHAEYLALLVEEAKAAKRAGKFYRLPENLSASDRKRIWARAFSELRQADAKGCNKTPPQRGTAGRHPAPGDTTEPMGNRGQGYSAASRSPADPGGDQGRASPV